MRWRRSHCSPAGWSLRSSRSASRPCSSHGPGRRPPAVEHRDRGRRTLSCAAEMHQYSGGAGHRPGRCARRFARCRHYAAALVARDAGCAAGYWTADIVSGYRWLVRRHSLRAPCSPPQSIVPFRCWLRQAVYGGFPGRDASRARHLDLPARDPPRTNEKGTCRSAPGHRGAGRADAPGGPAADARRRRLRKICGDLGDDNIS